MIITMKTIKFLTSMLLAVSCISLTGCKGEETVAPTPDKVTTGEATEITTQSAVLTGRINMDIKDYNSVEFGMMVSDNLQDMNNRKGDKVLGKTLIGKDYTIALNGLTDNLKYYYCAFVLLNGTQYEFGAIKNFTTLKSSMVKDDGFSVSATKLVRFSPGNLQYTRSTDTWSFAEHQYDMIGTDNVVGGIAAISTEYGYYKEGSAVADKIDLFGWSGNTGSAEWGISTLMDDSDCRGDFVDWGKNIGDGKTWYTLTADEWYYVLFERTNADQLTGVARINFNADGTKYANGLILLPDNWTCPAGVTFRNGFSSTFSIYEYAFCQTLTLSDWQNLEAANAVFLPTSGYRIGANVYYVQPAGFYWSATPIGSGYARYLYFYSNGATTDLSYYDYGHAVRLVRDLDSK